MGNASKVKTNLRVGHVNDSTRMGRQKKEIDKPALLRTIQANLSKAQTPPTQCKGMK